MVSLCYLSSFLGDKDRHPPHRQQERESHVTATNTGPRVCLLQRHPETRHYRFESVPWRTFRCHPQPCRVQEGILVVPCNAIV